MDRIPPQIRRVVTGHDAAGRAVVWRDGDATNHKYPGEKVSSTLIWVTDAAPATFLTNEDAGARLVGTAPPAAGTRFCIMEFEPGNEVHGMHRTDTTDYVVCLAGEIDMDLDEGTVTLCSGDVMVQRGTNHVWVNRSADTARLAVVLIDGEPKRPGSIGGSVNAR